MGFLFLKFPLGIMSFVLTLVLLVVPTAFLFAPIAWGWGFDNLDFDIPFWNVDTFGETLLLAAFGLMGLLCRSTSSTAWAGSGANWPR